MDTSQFTDRSPGRLVPITFFEPRLVEGKPRRIELQGLSYLPDPLPPKIDWHGLIFRIAEALTNADRLIGRLDGLAENLPDQVLISRPLRLSEAQLSSRIENTVATIEQVAFAEADPANASDEALEVSNYDRALQHGLESPLPICLRLIREMHGILMTGVRGRDKRPGEFRHIQNYIGNRDSGFAGARFVPPPPCGPLDECLAAFEYFLNDQPATELPLLVRCALAHYQFEAIHPFADGNGRIGRLLAALQLCRPAGLAAPLVYVSGYFEKHRERYYGLLLDVSTRGAWEEWIRFFLGAVAVQADDAVRRARRLLDLRAQYHAQVVRKKSSSLVPLLIDHLFAHPVVTVGSVAAQLKITVAPAQRHIDTLVKHEILTETTGKRYGRRYAARGIIRAIEEELPSEER